MAGTYKTLLQAGALIAMAGGAMDAALGVGVLRQLGSTVPASVAAIPELDSQARFYGMILIGYGALTWLYATDMKRYAPVTDSAGRRHVSRRLHALCEHGAHRAATVTYARAAGTRTGLAGAVAVDAISKPPASRETVRPS